MAYICDDCKYIFSSRRSNCPYCGGRVYNSTVSEADLLNTGYSPVPARSTANTAHPEPPDPFSYDDLRSAYFSTDGPESSHKRSAGNSPQNQNSFPVSSQTDSSSGVDYFSQFSSTPAPNREIPVVEQTFSQRSARKMGQSEGYRREMADLNRQQRRLERRYRARSVIDYLAGIRLGAVIRILVIICLVILLITAWQMRYVIFQSIVSFLVSLLPLILVAWIFWRLLRSLFH